MKEANVAALCNQARESGYTLTFGEPTSITKDGISRHGRRVALLTMMPATPVDITDNSNKTCAFLLASGRWAERLIPTGNGDHHMIVACLYGYPGASQDKHDQKYHDTKIKNEALIAAAATHGQVS